MRTIISVILITLAAQATAIVYLEPTPQFKPRFEIAAIYLEYNDKILLLHRQENKSQGNKWGIPGGKVNKGETALQAVIRETEEETGYDISKQEIEDLGTVYIEYDEKDHFTYHMFRTQLQGDPAVVKINFTEHKGFTWVTPSDGLKMDLLKDEDPCFKLVYFPDYFIFDSLLQKNYGEIHEHSFSEDNMTEVISKEICYLSSSRLIQAMKSGELSAVEVMEQHLNRIEKMNPLLNGLVQQLSREECLTQALQADQKRINGLKLGKLHGLPITIKDSHLVKGFVSCVGCTGLKNKIAENDSTIISRLKNEGAIIIGITNVPELLASYETNNDVYGRTNNPYNLDFTPGGSSGGCAALVASGCIPLSIGSDAAGSLRWPAHCTGIATHKPTTGLVPRTGSTLGNAKGLFAQFATSGPMARCVEDLILALQVISGPDGIDPHCPPVDLNDPIKVDISRLRVAYFLEDGVSSPTDEVLDVLQMVIKKLQNQVIKVDKIECKCLKDSYRLLWQSFFLGGDQGKGTQELLKTLEVSVPSPLLQDFLIKAKEQNLSTSQVHNLFIEIDQFRIEMLETLKEYDVLISLVAGTPAKKHGKCLEESKDMAPCMVHSLTGWPVTVIRCGTSSQGLPIGIQIAAKPWNDHICLALAKRLESLLGDWPPVPERQ